MTIAPAIAAVPHGQQLTEPITPELALVCPELRSLALALLPDRDPDAFARVRAAPPGRVSEDEIDESEQALAAAAAVYAGRAVAATLVFGAKLTFLLVGLMGLAGLVTR